ncbi:MAG: hypothetical protein K8953_02295, partial [Proteobacteria bacterium]|nr:hypothetical protein [Pseudomonadota bacterium]
AFADVLAARNAICGYGAGTNPFDPLCNDHPSQNVNQQNFCGESREGYSSQKATDCAPLIARICAGPNSVSTRVGAGEYNCFADDMFASDREVTCGATDPAGDPVCGPIITALCTGANAFAPAVGLGFYPCSTNSAFDGARDSYCRTAAFGDDLCAGARMTRICLAGDSPFSAICGADDGMMNAEERAVACATGNGGTSAFCGSETSVGDSYIKTYCGTEAGKTNVTYCPNTYEAANPVNRATDVVNVDDLTDKVLNADGTGLERVIGSGRANRANDDRANFIEGNADGVSLGINVIHGPTVRLNPTSGFAASWSVTSTFQQYYYVGLLSGTNLGGLLPTATTPTTLKWSAKLSLLTAGALQDEQDFTLLVELSDQTISGSKGGIFGFTIDGNFTKNGLIYGRFVSNLVTAGGSTGEGTLTGLIGARGAVGIFKSNPNT